MRILLQFPEGLKKEALAHAARMSSQGNEVFLSASACYGACDLALEEARAIKAQKLVHFGHAEFMKMSASADNSPSASRLTKVKVPGLRVEYVPYFAEVDWKAAGAMLEKAASLLRASGAKKVSLVFPIQHLKNAKRVQERLEHLGLIVLMGKGGSHVRHAGQVLGCDGTAAVSGKARDADAIVYFGGGKFHPTGIPSGKPVLCADPHLVDAYWITDEIARQEKCRNGALLAASQARTFGILLSTKPGQQNTAGAQLAKKLLEKKGRRAEMLVANEFSPLALANFLSFDAYINTACPRIVDDREAYGKPVVNISEIKRLLEIMV
ncbi:MAG: diphthamide biosynthesis enzyme Dph2 [Candidatus Micrarchaeota archaeon]|nr:diphthamide biosynthesis enzyme Dph2 [Candidatus Micrarchaeota archaeon]